MAFSICYFSKRQKLQQVAVFTDSVLWVIYPHPVSHTTFCFLAWKKTKPNAVFHISLIFKPPRFCHKKRKLLKCEAASFGTDTRSWWYNLWLPFTLCSWMFLTVPEYLWQWDKARWTELKFSRRTDAKIGWFIFVFPCSSWQHSWQRLENVDLKMHILLYVRCLQIC